ncbi:CHRD domain-containing protein [Solirhodobacter olei]|uniref:CHRD domain-containing protein n=1 Tax=Solirhodobacter olei TaxID=2493082 RepID=UPI000FD95D26|nr:CHRD domain-containing protein [Solirhodobacter olei]
MLKTFALAAAVAAMMSAPATAKILKWSATLDQAQETAAKVKAPGATGTASGTLDTVKHVLTWHVRWSHLSGHATGVHFHGPAKRGQNAGVLVNIGKDSGLKTPTSGHVRLKAKAVKEIEEGLWYVNVHTKKNPGGEIRGQVEVVK